MMDRIRKPAVAGYFYPATKEDLLQVVKSFINAQSIKEECISAICPHAGYIFSGPTAGLVYSTMIIPETVILIGPNHSGYGEPFAVSDVDYWNTPLGNIKVDTEVSKALIYESRYLEADNVAHSQEHSLEVQIPFIQFLSQKTQIVPIALSGYIDNPAWIEIGDSIANVIKKYQDVKKITIIASTDMNHYETEEITQEKDNYAIEAILSLDEEMLIERIVEKNISMCGYGPVITTIVASKALGAKEATLIDHTTSGHKNRDYSQVVGYVGITIK